jgi:hypothetical protein
VKTKIKALILSFAGVLLFSVPAMALIPAPGPQSDSTGVEGVIPKAPPSQAATIGVPKNGQTFSNIPITVSGLCPNNTLVEIYKNNVFAGSIDCLHGSYNLLIDLFDGRNDLIARVYDSLNQAGPDSSVVTVTFSNPLVSDGPRVSLTTQYAKRGANPGSILNWPITLTGGTGPYAISVDWGDKTDTELISQQIPGDINLQHTYAQAGVYKVVVKAGDANGNTAFLQLVGIGNGAIQQSTTNNNGGIITNEKVKVLWWPISMLFVLTGVAYWLGQKHQLEAIRRRLRKGEAPFK